jgi:hypothetical protein
VPLDDAGRTHRSQVRWASGSDRLLAGTRFVAAFGELHVPPLSELSDALTTIGNAGLHTRIKFTPAASKRLWRADGDPIVRCIPEAVASGTVAEMLEYVRRRQQARRPLELHVSDRYLILDIDHGLGDGRFSLELVSAVLALSGGVRQPWVDQRNTLLVLPRAVVRTFARHPAQAAEALRHAAGSRHSQMVDPVTAAGDVVSWSPSFAVSVAHVDADSEGAVEDWRRSRPDKIGSASVWLYVVTRALLQAGIEMQDRMMFAFDSRRYLPKGQTVSGNFAVGLSLPFSDDETPQGFDHRIQGLIKSAVPLAGQAAIAARSLFGARRSSATQFIQRDKVRADVMYSDIGHITILGTAPWRDHRLCTATALIDPAGPQSITAVNTRVGATRNIAISYHDNVFERNVIDQAAHYMSQPLQLLNSALVDGTTQP